MGRNKIRLKHHYHACPFRLKSDFLLKIYDLYSRILGFNRYTIILGKSIVLLNIDWLVFVSKFRVVGSTIPSIITTLSNAVSVRWIIAVRQSLNEQSRISRRLVDETRRMIIIITVECLLMVINS